MCTIFASISSTKTEVEATSTRCSAAARGASAGRSHESRPIARLDRMMSPMMRLSKVSALAGPPSLRRSSRPAHSRTGCTGPSRQSAYLRRRSHSRAAQSRSSSGPSQRSRRTHGTQRPQQRTSGAQQRGADGLCGGTLGGASAVPSARASCSWKEPLRRRPLPGETASVSLCTARDVAASTSAYCLSRAYETPLGVLEPEWVAPVRRLPRFEWRALASASWNEPSSRATTRLSSM
mmetsp:Transcript_48064/g.142039  ORF Transcript_48064/g.142039 Transcript_48064/m.142039 type:complete len:236 (+) Transcript_48064:1214-1921(+)